MQDNENKPDSVVLEIRWLQARRDRCSSTFSVFQDNICMYIEFKISTY